MQPITEDDSRSNSHELLEMFTLDQLRMLVSVAEQGSFSAAGRKLGRVQSAVSQGVANLEAALGVVLFQRNGRKPTLTAEGKALLVDARRVLARAGALRVHAAAIADGVEAELSIVVDAIVPARLLVELCREFQERFPAVALRVQTAVLDSVARLVREGGCHVGVSGPIGVDDPSLVRRRLAVAAPSHPLARVSSPISAEVAEDLVQIVISRPKDLEASTDHAVLAARTWRVADTSTKLALIRAGLGWGTLPSDLVDADVASGRLVRLDLLDFGPDTLRAQLFTVHRADRPPGVSARWLLGHLHEGESD